MNSTCSYHMCPNNEWFYNLEKLEGGLDLHGNDQTCDFWGIGKIKLKLYDGTIFFLSLKCTNFKKNLISMDLLESKGLKTFM